MVLSAMKSLHERIAAELKCPVREVRSFSLPALREMVRFTNPALADEIANLTQTSQHIRQTGSFT